MPSRCDLDHNRADTWSVGPPRQPAGGFSMVATNLTGGVQGVGPGASGLPGQYFDLVAIQRWASSSVGKSPM